MRLLVIGSGAREHALVAKLAGERDVAEVVCCPGNPGIATLARCLPADPADPKALLAIAEREQVDLTIVGPELPLARGIADRFAAAGRLLLGPTAAAAALECSKAFAKAFMARHGVPTARYRIAETADAALSLLRSREFGFPVVLKADGLAAGKGVVIAPDLDAAESAVRAAMIDRRFGDAGARLVVEECLEGPEVSFFVLADGRRAVPLLSAQDHKRVFDGDRGPNTGGMGAFAPSPLMTPALQARVMHDIVEPVVAGMAADGHPFRGFLYAGLMITADGPKVIEFNVRLGDPEAQVVLPMLDEPLLPLVASAAMGELHATSCRLRPDKHVGVVLASGGYPDTFETGRPIAGLEDAERTPDVLVFQAGTARQNGRLVTAGGRVVTIVGRGPDFQQAIARAYAGVSKVSFEGMHYRKDIGQKAG